MRSLLVPSRLPSLLELLVDGAPLHGAALLGAELFLALDRPDRLEVRLKLERGAERHAALRPGAAVTARLEALDVFTGAIERTETAMDPVRGACRSLVAYAGFESRRRLSPRDRYVSLTDAEIAARIAGELGLAPCVERTTEVHAELERHEDPLVFLRGRARRIGFQLGVTSGRLCFARSLPARGEIHRLERGLLVSRLVELRLGDRPTRGGAVEVAGDARLRPLVRLEVAGEAGLIAVRTLHRLDADGYRSRVEFLETGADLALWREAPGQVEER